MIDVHELCQVLVPVPNPMTSESQADQFSNRDLHDEDDATLHRMLSALHITNLLEADDWRLERELAIRTELGFRRHRRQMQRDQREAV